jgi:chloramphenicol 3-O-phosphotransferase
MEANWEVTLTLIDQSPGTDAELQTWFGPFCAKLTEKSGQPIVMSAEGTRWTIPLSIDVGKPWEACQQAVEMVFDCQSQIDGLELWLVGVEVLAQIEVERRFDQTDKVREARELLVESGI